MGIDSGCGDGADIGDAPAGDGLCALASRAEFPLLARNPGLHYLDSAATSQKPKVVLDAQRDFYETANANPHRGAYRLSAAATDAYHEARAKVARFIGAADSDSLIFTRGTTESINLVASSWGRTNVKASDEIVVTAIEHHANFVPRQQLALSTGAKLRIVELTASHEIDLDQLRDMVNARTKVVAITHVSNALGSITPLDEVTQIVRSQSGAIISVDGAQGAPHLPVNFDTRDVDFYAFSGHKMLGPMGIGGLMGKRAILNAMPPYQFGGDMIEWVNDQDSTWNTVPHKFEAGTPNAADAVGLGAAADYLGALGMEHVRAHEKALLEYALHALAEVPGCETHGPAPERRSGVVSFAMQDIHPHDLATILDQHDVCVRAGHHCAQPLMRRLGVSATARASFYVYSDKSDVDALCAALADARTVFGG
ncbi:MAG: cysteine desulfurase [Phycisphaerae bacterium]|nr:cysteine desulfurase [Gemmatimonadaceae bacterium]